MLWLNIHPLSRNPLRGHKRHHCTSKQPTHSPPHHPTWHVRQHWPQQWFIPFDGKMPELLFTSGSLLACLSVACGPPGSLMSSGGDGGASHQKKRGRGGSHIGSTCWIWLSETHGQNQTQCLIRESFSTLMAGQDERCGCTVALWLAWSKVFWIRTVRYLSERCEQICGIVELICNNKQWWKFAVNMEKLSPDACLLTAVLEKGFFFFCVAHTAILTDLHSHQLTLSTPALPLSRQC